MFSLPQSTAEPLLTDRAQLKLRNHQLCSIRLRWWETCANVQYSCSIYITVGTSVIFAQPYPLTLVVAAIGTKYRGPRSVRAQNIRLFICHLEYSLASRCAIVQGPMLSNMESSDGLNVE